MSGYFVSTSSMPFCRSSCADWPIGPCSTTMLPLPPSLSAIICISCAPAATSSGCTLAATSELRRDAFTSSIGMPAAFAFETWACRESAWTGTTMIASTFALTYWSIWLACVLTSRLAEFQSRSMLLALA